MSQHTIYYDKYLAADTANAYDRVISELSSIVFLWLFDEYRLRDFVVMYHAKLDGLTADDLTVCPYISGLI